MESARAKVEIGQFKVIDRHLNSVRITLGQGVNAWIHMNFDHNVQPGDDLTLFTEVDYAFIKSTPK